MNRKEELHEALDKVLIFAELVIEPKPGESEDDFIGRCVKKEMDGGMEQDQALAVCYSKWDNK